MKQEFYTGRMFDAYRFFGAHEAVDEKGHPGIRFTVYAPAAKGVDVIGDFNEWVAGRDPLEQVGRSGVWTCFCGFARPGMYYKYVIHTAEGWSCEHTDPYARQMELRPKFAAVISPQRDYEFTDSEWLAKRRVEFDRPTNIYEVHASSWRQKNIPADLDLTEPDDASARWLSYRELAEGLIPYLKEHCYTHVEFMPLTEYPADESWGYQVSGFFAPTARYGSPAELKAMVDAFHRAGIGVILDFVPVHFALDYYGLAKFDGSKLYEYPSSDTGISDWGSKNFNYYRGEVCSFLQSAADYWLTEFHFDGLRIDALANLIYWQGDVGRGLNEGAVRFVQTMNEGLKKRHPGVLLMAEDSSSYPKVTAPVAYDGLGFDFKWDMGWMNDTLSFFQSSPAERKERYHQLSFSMMYFYSENFLLPLSHDEVSNGKASILQKMNGDYEQKFPQARLLYSYMYTHPGKKLNFMGNEWGHLREWHYWREMDWGLLKYPLHDGFRCYIKKLSELYMSRPALHKADYAEDSFRWLEVDRADLATYVYERKAEDDSLIVVLNTSADCLQGFTFGCDSKVTGLQLLLNSDESRFGGRGLPVKQNVVSTDRPYRDWSHSLTLDVPPLTALIYEVNRVGKTAADKKKKQVAYAVKQLQPHDRIRQVGVKSKIKQVRGEHL